MAKLYEIMLQAQLESTDPNKAQDWSEPFLRGAQVAQMRQNVAAQRQQMEQQRQQIQEAKLDKFAEAVTKGQSYAGKAQSNYYNKFLPQYKNALGLQEFITDDALAFATATPENQARFHTLIADVREGRMSAQDAFANVSDPVKYADVTPTMLGQIGEAQKTFLGNAAQMARTQYTAQASAQRALEGDLRAGQVEASKRTADEWTKYELVGGRAAADKAEQSIDAAIKRMKDGEVKSGGLVEKFVPYGDTTMVLKRANPKLKELIDDVLSTQNIRAMTGDPNPTERQINDIYSRMFDPTASSEVNIAKMRKELQRMKSDRANKERQFQRAGFMAPDKAPAKETPGGGTKKDKAPADPFAKARAAIERQTNPAIKARMQQLLDAQMKKE